MGQVFNIFEY